MAALLALVALALIGVLALVGTWLHAAPPLPGVRWNVLLGAGDPGSATIVFGRSTGQLFVATGNDARLRALDALTGQLRRGLTARAQQAMLAIDDRGEHLFVADGAAVVMVAVRDSRTLRTIPLGSVPTAMEYDALSAHLYVAEAAANRVAVIDARVGHVVGTVVLPASPAALVIDARRERLFVAAGSRVVAVDTRHGRLLDSVATGEAIWLRFDERTAHLFVGVPNGHGVAMLAEGRSPTSLALARLSPAPGYPIDGAIDARRGRALVLTGDDFDRSVAGSVAVFDTRTGALVRTIPVGRRPQALAIDERTGRVFVANAGDGAVAVYDPRTGHLIKTIAVGGSPLSLEIDQQSGQAAVAIDRPSPQDPWWLSSSAATSIALLDAVR